MQVNWIVRSISYIQIPINCSMRKISSWAAGHKWSVRILMVLLYLPLNFLGLVIGDLIFDFGITLSGYFLLSLFVIVLFVIYRYPKSASRKTRNEASFYYKRKASDLILISCTFCMICFTGNQLNVAHPFTLTTVAIPYNNTANNTTTSVSASAAAKVISSPVSTPSHRKAIKKKFRNILQQLRAKYKRSEDGTKILLIFVAILLAIIIVLLVATLACAIGCGGAEAIAYILLTLGSAAAIFALVKVIQRLNRGPREKKPVPATTD